MKIKSSYILKKISLNDAEMLFSSIADWEEIKLDSQMAEIKIDKSDYINISNLNFKEIYYYLICIDESKKFIYLESGDGESIILKFIEIKFRWFTNQEIVERCKYLMENIKNLESSLDKSRNKVKEIEKYILIQADRNKKLKESGKIMDGLRIISGIKVILNSAE
jgi:hypothetical protein